MRAFAPVVALGAALVVAACWYSDPAYNQATFKCDATHACPDPQTCINGLCVHTSASFDGVVCGATTCTGAEKCCAQITGSGTAMLTCIAVDAPCAGTSASCDSQADCEAPAACCEGSPAACSTDAMCQRICTADSDCGAAKCCKQPALHPWGRCIQTTVCPP